MDSSSGAFIKTIEWDMMDKKKFFPLSMLSSFSVRCALFPLTVIKTQLQVRIGMLFVLSVLCIKIEGDTSTDATL